MELFQTMAILIQYPWLAAVVGAALLVTARRSHRKTPVLVGISWLLYALYETGMKQRWLCTGECNIRVDLLLIYPVLLAGLVAAAVSLYRSRRNAQ